MLSKYCSIRKCLWFKNKFGLHLNFIHNDFNRDKTMIIHHGLMGSANNFKSLSKHPDISNYVNTYLVDSRNHGKSPHANTHNISDLAEDLDVFIKENIIKNKKESGNKLILMGHSLGGLAVMEWVKNFPQHHNFVNRIIIIDIPCKPLSQSKKQSFKFTGQMLRQLHKINLTHTTIQQIHAKIQKITMNQDIANLLKTALIIVGQQKWQWKFNLKIIVQNYDNIGSFNGQGIKWTKPVDLIYGSISPYVSQIDVNQYIQLFPQMKPQNIHRIEGAGHWVHFEKTIQFLHVMKQILNY